MSTFQRLTLIGLFNHYPLLFSKLELPAAYDINTFTDTLLLDHGEKRVAYPEPQFMEYAIGVWSRKWSAALERIALALNSEYNPIHNYDRHEEWSDHSEGDYRNDVKRGGSDTTTSNGETETNSTGTVDRDTTTSETTNSTKTTENTVSAYNESNYQPHDKTEETGNVITGTTGADDTSTSNNETTTATNTETTAYGGTEDGTGDERRDSAHDGHLYGNIGVKSSQSMVAEEVALRRDNNMYSIAAELFADDLLLMLY